jgi:hypothetical protein
MRHRSPRPFLDLWRRRPGLPPLRRGTVVAGAAAAFVAASGLALAAHEATAPEDRPSAGVEAPGLTTPTATDRSPAPSRSSDRPALPDRRPSSLSPSPTHGPQAAAPSTGLPTPSDLVSALSLPTQKPDRTAGSPAGTVPTKAPSTARTSTSPGTASSPDTSGSAPSSTTRGTTPSDSTSSPAPSRSADDDGTAPQTTVSTVSSNALTWVVALGADEPATFECDLDGEGYAPCAASASFPLAPGQHTLAVRATDPAGNTDASPAVVTAQINAGAGD